MSTLDSLIDIIYESIDNASIWPIFLRSLNVNSAMQSDQLLRAELMEFSKKIANQNEEKVFKVLSPHIERCIQVSQKLNDLQKRIDSADALINQIPFGVFIVNKSGKFVRANFQAKTLLERGLANICNGYLILTNKSETNLLYTKIDALFNDNNGETKSLRLAPIGEGMGYHLLLSCSEQIDSIDADFCCLYFIPDREKNLSSPKILREMYDLSPAESLTVYHLVNGLTVHEIGQTLTLSKNTIRSHLKSAFLKTNTNSQSELVSLVLKSPAIFNIDRRNFHAELARSNTELVREGSVSVDRNRQLAYAEFGDFSGKPVVLFHDLFSCRYFNPGSNEILNRLNVRLVVIERPGYGISDIDEAGTVGTYLDDVLKILTELQINKAYFVGYSLGAAYVLSLAERHPELCRGISLVSAIIPPYSVNHLVNIKCILMKLSVGFGLYAPGLLRPLMNMFSEGVVEDTESFIQAQIDHLQLSDRKILFKPEIYRNFVSNFRESMRLNGHGLYKDIYLMTSGWPLSIQSINTPAHIWHGSSDDLALWQVANKLCELKNYNINLIDGGGHLIIYEKWEDILVELLQS